MAGEVLHASRNALSDALGEVNAVKGRVTAAETAIAAEKTRAQGVESSLTTSVAQARELAQVAKGMASDEETRARAKEAELAAAIAAVKQFCFKVVDELPLTGDANTIYLVPSSHAVSDNVKDEYIYVSGAWEQIGSTAVDLSAYAKTVDVPQVDATLEVSGAAADAATVGEKLSEKVGIDADGNVEISGEMTVCGIFRVDGGGEIDVMQDGNKVSLMSSGAIVLNDSTRLEFPTQEGTFALTTDPASGLTDDAVTALFASSVSCEAIGGTAKTSAANIPSGGVVDITQASGAVNVTFADAVGNALRYCELIVRGVTSDGGVTINLPSGMDALYAEGVASKAGINHYVFAEYSRGHWLVSRSTRTATI